MTGCSEKEAVYNPVPYIQYNEVKIVGKSNVKFEDSIEVEIIKSNEVFNKMEITFQRDLIPEHDNQVKLSIISLALYDDDTLIDNDTVKLHTPRELIVYYGASPYTFHVGKFRFDILISKDIIYRIQLTSTQ